MQQNDVTGQITDSVEMDAMHPLSQILLYFNNVRGMTGKRDSIHLSSISCDYDIIVLFETWLKKNKFSAEFFDPRFIVYRKDRCDSNIDASKGGGVLIAIDSKYDSDIVSVPELEHLEAICVKVHLRSSNTHLFIYALYIQYGSSEAVYLSHLKAITAAHAMIKHGDIFIAIGDFNMPAAKWSANEDGFDYLPLIGTSESEQANIARTMTSSLLDCGLFQMSDLMNKYGNVLDLAYTNMPELFIVSRADLPLIPESMQDDAHVQTQCTIECEPSAYISPSSSEMIYCFRKAPFELIREELLDTDFDALFADKSLDDMLNALYARCYELFDLHIPKATLRTTNHPIWYDKKLINLKNRRNRAYKKLLDRRNMNDGHIDDSSFLSIKNEFESYQNDLYNGFLSHLAINYKKQPKKFWNFINSKYKKSALPGKMFYNDEHATNDDGKANLFAKFFASVYKTHPDDVTDDETFLSFINSRDDHGYLNVTITPEIVRQVLRRMDLSKGVSSDKMAPLFLRECADVLAEPLSSIYSKSLSDVHYPELWKTGHLTPIYKQGKKADITNYRGVCVSPNFAKVFEIIVFDQISFNILPQVSLKQHGFYPGRRVETNLMELSILVHESFKNGNQTDIFLADIKKAFDVIRAIRLLMKLSNDKYRLCNSLLLWLRSFFMRRKQIVKINSGKSDLIDVHSGIGQGSILAALNFLVYFNDSDGSSAITRDINFADDKKIVHNSISSIDDTHSMQASIDEFLEWCSANDFVLNAEKCKVITISRKNSPILAEYYMDGEPIKRVVSTKDVGVTYDNKFSFKDHTELAKNKAMSMLSFIKRQCYGRFNVNTAKMLYSAVVRSHLEFASTVWAPHHDVHIQSLESVQRQFVLYANRDRYVDESQDSYRLRPYMDRCAELNLKSLLRRRTNAAVFFIHDVLTGKINSHFIRERIELNDGSRVLRAASMIRIKGGPEYLQYSSLNFACRLFNRAVNHVDPTLPSHEFKRSVNGLEDSVFGMFGRAN